MKETSEEGTNEPDPESMESEAVGASAQASEEETEEEEEEETMAGGSSEEDESESGAAAGVETSAEKQKAKSEVYVPGSSRPLKEGEVLEFDESAYRMLHRFRTTYPCLSFDCLPASTNTVVDNYPLTFYMVAGTQTESSKQNSVVLMKLKNMNEMKHEDDSDDENSYLSSDDEEEEGSTNKPTITFVNIPLKGGINRIRATKIIDANLCATWNERRRIDVWNLGPALRAVDTVARANESIELKQKPLFTFAGHLAEGFAMDWSQLVSGRLATGDCRGNIHLWTMKEGGGGWVVDQRPFTHKSSVEDIQWSPQEQSVFCSCSSDHSIKIWDTRTAHREACVCHLTKAHKSDVNVISWNRLEPLLVSGGDDGSLKIWDFRYIKDKEAVAEFFHHKKAITSVHWYPHESTVFAAAGEDNQVTIWDLSVEEDNAEQPEDAEQVKDIPPQLLFIHQGQEEIKEIRWHPEAKGVLVSTALDDFNVFRTITV